MTNNPTVKVTPLKKTYWDEIQREHGEALKAFYRAEETAQQANLQIERYCLLELTRLLQVTGTELVCLPLAGEAVIAAAAQGRDSLHFVKFGATAMKWLETIKLIYADPGHNQFPDLSGYDAYLVMPMKTWERAFQDSWLLDMSRVELQPSVYFHSRALPLIRRFKNRDGEFWKVLFPIEEVKSHGTYSDFTWNATGYEQALETAIALAQFKSGDALPKGWSRSKPGFPVYKSFG